MGLLTQPLPTRSDRVSDADLRVSFRLVPSGLVAAGVILFFVSERLPDGAVRAPLQTLVLLMQASAVVVWLAGEWRPWLARWLAPAAVAGFVFGLDRWLGVPGTLTLLAVPVALASVTISLAGGAALASALTLLLVAPSQFLRPVPDPGTTTVAITMMWLVLGVTYLAHRPARQLAEWSTSRFELAERLLEEARSHRAELAQARDDLAGANRRLALGNERVAALRAIAEQAQKAKSAFVARVSHEFRTPLNMIFGLIDLLTETPEVYGRALPAALMEDLGIVQRNCGHLASMINDVLDLSQAEGGRLVLHRETVDLAQIAQEAEAVVRPLMQKKRLTFIPEIPSDLPSVQCDRVRIRQVLLNLLSNAARFTERGSIRLRIEMQPDHALVSVIDTGPGMSPEEAEGVFEPFCQGGGSIWREKGGSGLGLSISKQLIELHGGRISFESVVGEGTTFSFVLPVAPPLPHPARPGHQIMQDWVWVDRPSGPDIAESAKTHRVVLCDETGALHKTVSRIAPDEIALVHTQDLDEAIREVTRLPAHAFIVNSMSPERLRVLVGRASREIQQAPVIGCAVPAPLRRALEAGAIDYLIKPVTRGQLQESLRAVGGPVHKVLLVDDDPDVLQLLNRMLAVVDPTIETFTASTGAQALDQLGATQPDLMLLDIVLPDFDGWHVLRMKSEDSRLCETPVILLSAQDPTNRPLSTDYLLVTIDGGLSVSRMLDCSLRVSELLLQPEPAPDPMPG